MMLDEVVDLAGDILRSAPIEVTGYTDSFGTNEDNLALSEYWAKKSADYLISKGVDSQRLTVKWLGEEGPEYVTGDDTVEPLNRRVEVNFVSPPIITSRSY